MYLLQLTNDAYSDDIRTRGPFKTLPTREDVIKEFGSIGPGDYDTQTYSVINVNTTQVMGEITCYDDDETSWGCLK